MADPTRRRSAETPEQVQQRVRELGPWFHNLELEGVRTAPDHFLGDYPTVKWQMFRDSIEPDLRGRSVLDIGCNGGFYCFEMKRRGADRVLGIDPDDGYLAQARFAAHILALDVEFRKMSVYELDQIGEKFDWVLFLGVLYHLRHPLLALDLIREHATKRMLVFQSMQRGSERMDEIRDDYSFHDLSPFELPGFPKLHFVERSYAGDPSNWWIPNRACSAAMLRSSGFRIVSNPESEVFICELDTSEGPNR